MNIRQLIDRDAILDLLAVAAVAIVAFVIIYVIGPLLRP
jgi:hypothetical protein